MPIERIPWRLCGRSIGFIPQDTFLFGETIRENIAVWRGVRVGGGRSSSSGDFENSSDVEEFPGK